MIWLVVIGLAVAAVAIGLLVFKVPRATLTSFAAALVLGLAGYATQASPDLPGAPKSAVKVAEGSAGELIEIRRMLSGSSESTPSPGMLLADAMTRKGQHDQAAGALSALTTTDPDNAEVWLALGNALVEHAKGARTRPAMFAYRKAAELNPDSLGPGYFIGLSFIREGDFGETRKIWAETLEKAPETAPGKQAMTAQLGRLDQLLMAAMAAAQQEQTPQP